MFQLIAVVAAVASNIQWHWIDNNLAAGICGALLAWFAERLYRRVKDGSVEPWNEGLRQCYEQKKIKRPTGQR